MIYDLKVINEQSRIAFSHAMTRETELACLQVDALLAIAERLEALVEAQKPRWVEFEYYDRSATCFLLADQVRRIYETNTDFDRGVVLTLVGGDYYNVKGTLAEVMAKLRGEYARD